MPDFRNHLADIYRAAIAAVDPAVLVARALDGAVSDSEEIARLISGAADISLLAIGKGSYAMAAEFQRRHGGRIEAGLAVVPAINVPLELPGIRVMPGGHPIPNQSSADVADAAIQLLKSAGGNNLVVVLLSGGASAMFAAPAAGISLEDKIAVTSALLRSGATIRELNCVRKHISAVKGGGLLNSLSDSARVVTLILSDVPGDDMATIGSGLTVADPSTYADAIAILKRRRIWGRAPEAVRAHLESGMAGDIPETLKSTAPVFQRVSNLLIGNNATAVDAAADEARRLGFSIERWRELKGEADDLGREIAIHLSKITAERVCVVAGGEPVATVRGRGRGGRAQQLALAAALELSHSAPNARIGLLAAGTDGIDGPTDAAGAFAFPDTVARAREKNLDPEAASKRNDAYNLFDAIGDLFKTGPTGTNVTDLMIGLVNC